MLKALDAHTKLLQEVNATPWWSNGCKKLITHRCCNLPYVSIYTLFLQTFLDWKFMSYSKYGLIACAWYYIRNTPKHLLSLAVFQNQKLKRNVKFLYSTFVVISWSCWACVSLYLELISTLCQKQFLIKMKEWDIESENGKEKNRATFLFETVSIRTLKYNTVSLWESSSDWHSPGQPS